MSTTAEKIEELRRRFGPSLSIIGHHYQSDEVIRHTDLRGDSLELARKVAGIGSEHIVFCGVYFMGESAALLARRGQKIHLPDHDADCSMARMTADAHLRPVLDGLCAGGRNIVPLAYVNSTLAVKAVVGEHGGSVCTSANAGTMLKWALERGDAVLFLPDKNLGLNTAKSLGIGAEERLVLELGLDLEFLAEGGNPASPNAGLRPLSTGFLQRAEKARLLLWPGYCSIHTRFTPERIGEMRTLHHGARVIVHPECPPEVVDAADAAGSTSFLIKYTAEAPPGSTIVIGTESNLVRRLAKENSGRITVLPLEESLCEYMAKITEERLLAVLEAIAAGSDRFVVTVDESRKDPARAALERMLAACS